MCALGCVPRHLGSSAEPEFVTEQVSATPFDDMQRKWGVLARAVVPCHRANGDSSVGGSEGRTAISSCTLLQR